MTNRSRNLRVNVRSGGVGGKGREGGREVVSLPVEGTPLEKESPQVQVPQATHDAGANRQKAVLRAQRENGTLDRCH